MGPSRSGLNRLAVGAAGRLGFNGKPLKAHHGNFCTCRSVGGCMAYLHRLIFCAAVALMAWLPASSFATITAVVKWGTFDTASACLTNVLTGWDAANPNNKVCATAADRVISATRVERDYRILNGGTPSTCSIPSTTGWSVIGCNSTLVCPANSTVSGSSCVCNAGFAESSGLCVTTSQSACDGLNSSKTVLTAIGVSGVGLTTCYGGVLVKASGAAFGSLGGTGTNAEYFGPFTCSTTPCTGVTTGGSSSSPTSPPVSTSEPSAAGCKPTQYWGYVNGLGTCVDAVSTSSGGSSQTAPTPSGSTSAPTSGLGPDAPPAATGSTTQTDCARGVCTTTTSYTKADGTSAGSKAETKPQESFCRENPEASVCLKSSYSSGSCGSPPSCSGDAIQCAIAAESFKTSCALAPPPSDESALYDSSKSLTGNQTTNLPGNSTVNISSGSFDQTDLIGGAAGLSNVSLSVMGTPMTLDFTQLNLWLSRLGSLLMVVTFLLSIRIVSRG